MEQHPIFSRFTGYVGSREAGMETTWIGARFPTAWYGGPSYEPGQVTVPIPAVSEEYFEWIELLDAVDAAHDKFVMLELGAGYGRWGICGALAAKQRGLTDIDIRFVEAEPQHAAWIKEAIKINGLDDIKTAVTESAISYSQDAVPFAVGGANLDSVNWWGQGIVPYASTDTGRTYFGKAVYRSEAGYDQILVEPVTLETLTADLDRINLIDMDLQGAEADLISNAIDTLTAKVERIFVATHGVDIEGLLRERLAAAGWTPRWDFRLQSEEETPFGPTTFGDGVQSWINPRLSRGPGSGDARAPSYLSLLARRVRDFTLPARRRPPRVRRALPLGGEPDAGGGAAGGA